MTLNRSVLSFAASALLLSGLYACEGCRATRATIDAPVSDVGSPTLRLYLLSNLAGALEPCGCSKDQLGGMDHLGAFIRSESKKAPASVTLAAGPTFFMEPELKGDRSEQDKAKAETIAVSLQRLGLGGLAWGENDWAGGDEFVKELAEKAGLSAKAGLTTSLRDVGGVKLGVISIPARGAPADLAAATKAALAELHAKGAQVTVALVAIDRGEAKRLADLVPDLALIVVGKKRSQTDHNESAPPVERIGEVLVIETANHLQTVGVLDLYVRDGGYRFADATGLERAQRRQELTRGIDDLRVKIANWEKDPKISQADIVARKADLERKEKERDALDVTSPPAKGSFFRFAMKEVRAKLGSDEALQETMRAFYKKVNERNRLAFADRKPRPAEAGQANFIGVEACATCHEPAKKFWDKTSHAKAYATLSTQFKEFNLECVSCHVTGYEMPGGSTVTHVDAFKNVQCETCHGPGSKHRDNPMDRTAIDRSPKASLCLTCHHPPHVEQFDAAAKMELIVGPGHGRGR
jgi:hypothetical protein